jgi:hypothetical protein
LRHGKSAVSLLSFGLATALQVYGQAETTPKPGPDVLLFTNGEKLIGHLESASGSYVVFKSDMAGAVTVDWKNIQELRSPQEFAAIRKNTKLRRSEDSTTVAQGAVAMVNQQLEVQPTKGSPQTIPVGDVGNVVDEASFQKAFRHANFFERWTGSATAGLSLTQATQKSRAVTAVANFVRAVPAVNWLSARHRTIFDFNEAYSKLTSPGSPAVKTSLYHISVEQDWYLSPRLFVFVGAGFDHNFSQGLSLQQTYGGGLGFVALKTDNQELDFKASVDYIDQRFETPGLNKSLIGSIFGETYLLTFAHGILLNEQAGITPAWNNTNAYSAFGSVALTFPIYHHFGLTLGALDNFLNDPPPGFKKNSFQLTAGATYSVK